MRLDIDSLRAFKTVIDAGGVTRAAQRLHLSQSAVSHKIARLEERIGRPLLRKMESGIGPTEDGRDLLTYAERLVAIHDEAAERFKRSQLSGRIRLGITEDAAGKELATILGRFKRLHPGVKLTARVAQSLTLAGWLKSKAIDLAILQVFENEIRPTDQVLWREDLIWVQAVDHPIAFDKDIPFVSFDERCFYRLAAERLLARNGRSLSAVLECPSAEGVRAGVRNGLGIALLNRRNLAPGIAEITSGLPAFPQVVHVVRSGERPAGRIELNLIETITRELAEAA